MRHIGIWIAGEVFNIWIAKEVRLVVVG